MDDSPASSGRYSFVEIGRIEDSSHGMEVIPPSQRPTLAVDRAKSLYPLAGVAAVITALGTAFGTVVAAFTGFFQPDMSETNTALREQTQALQSLERRLERHEQSHVFDDKRCEDRRREVDHRLDRQQQQLDALALRRHDGTH